MTKSILSSCVLDSKVNPAILLAGLRIVLSLITIKFCGQNLYPAPSYWLAFCNNAVITTKLKCPL